MYIPKHIKTAEEIDRILRVHGHRYKIAVRVCSASFVLVVIFLFSQKAMVTNGLAPVGMANSLLFFAAFSVGFFSNSMRKRYTLVDDGAMQKLEELVEPYPALHEALDGYLHVRPNLTKYEYKRFQHALKKDIRTDRRLARRAK